MLVFRRTFCCRGRLRLLLLLLCMPAFLVNPLQAQERIALDSFLSTPAREQRFEIYNAQGESVATQGYVVQEIEGTSSTRGSLVSRGEQSSAYVIKENQHLRGELQGDEVVLEEVPDLAHLQACGNPFHSSNEESHFEAQRAEAKGDAPLLARSTGPRSSSLKEIEMIAVASGDFVGLRSQDEAIDELIFAVEGANVYLKALGLRIRLAGVQLFLAGEEDPYAYAAGIQSAITMLDRLRGEWLFRSEPQRDLTVVFAGSNFGSIFGLSYTGASCLMPQFAYAFVSKGGRTGTLGSASLVSTLAHEVGHQIGMSHDASITAAGRTVMSANFVLHPAGFSPKSLVEFQAHEASGGAQCFAETQVETTASNSLFTPYTSQAYTIEEGQTLSLQFAPAGIPAPYYFLLEGLPEGAVFDPSSGLFQYTPSTSVVAAQGGFVDFAMSLAVVGTAGEMSIGLRVLDTNQVPRISFSSPQNLTASQFESLEVQVLAEDIDLPADAVTLRLLNRAALAFPGAPEFTSFGSQGLLRWRPAAPGRYEFVFQAVDAAGAAYSRSLIVNVRATNAAPSIEVASAVTVSSSNSSFDVVARDPENAPLQFEVQGLQPGVFLRRSGNTWTVDYANVSPEAKKESELVLTVSDGVQSTKKTILVTLGEMSAISSAMWPGTASTPPASDIQRGLFFYDGNRGLWHEASCEGTLNETYQFGGLVADMPLLFEEHGVHYPALYRVFNGQGIFIVRRKGQLSYQAWGLGGDVPLLADFDGDGISDYAVFRPSSDEWFIKFSSMPAQQLADMSGWKGSKTPFAKDIDGDGLADRVLILRDRDAMVFADVRLATGVQYIIGLAQLDLTEGAEPLVADVDTDGRADIVLRSTSGALKGIYSSSAAPFSLSEYAPGARVVHTDCPTGALGGLVTLSRFILLETETSSLPVLDVSFDAELLELYQMRQRSGALAVEPNDTDGDYRSDLHVWRPKRSRGIGFWYSLFSNGLASMSPWEYDADSVPAALAYEPERGASLLRFEAGIWHFFGLESGQRYSIPWGEPGDIAVSRDYNADSYADLAVFRPADGSWWISYGPKFQRSVRVDFGASGDIPVPADYDGDGVIELAVYRPALGHWIIRYHDGSAQVRSFGLAGDIPIPADYLGEGRAQFAVWRPSTGSWYVLRGGSEVVSRQWGLPGDYPIALDRDGDGRAELTVWRPSDGVWYSREIADGNDSVFLTQYGLPGDLPLGPLWSAQSETGPDIVM